MRVAQLVQNLSAGGAEKLAIEIARSRLALDGSSHLMSLAEAGPFRSLVDPAVQYDALNLAWDGRVGPSTAGSVLATYRQLENLIRDNDIDVVQTHLPMANFFGLVLAWRRRCKVFPTVHNTREFDYGDTGNRLRGALRRSAYRQMLTYCQTMIAVSDRVKAAMITELGIDGHWADRRLAVIPNGVHMPVAPTPEDIRSVRATFGVPEQAVLLVGAGRLTEQKNFADLLAALKRLGNDGGPWHCVLAGDGPLRGDLEQQASASGLAQRISLPGHVDDMGRLFGAADVFCLPSLWEGLPLVLLEAMAAGLPVVANAIDGVTDVVSPDEQALLVTPGDIDGWRSSLQALIRGTQLRKTMGEAGRLLVQEKFSFARVSSRLDEIYHGSRC